MKMNIKTRILLNGVISVVISISLVTAIVMFIQWDQAEERARQQIGRAVRLINLRLGTAESELNEIAAKIGQNQEYALNARFIQENRYNKALSGMLDGEKMTLAVKVYEAALASRVSKIVLCDLNGEWMCTVELDNANARISYHSDRKKWLAKETFVKAGEFPQSGQWETKLQVEHLLFKFPNPLPDKADTVIMEHEGQLWLTASAPLAANIPDYETLEEISVRVGVVQASKPVDSTFVKEICDLTNTGVNLFVNGQYVAGTLKSYTKLPPDWDAGYELDSAGILKSEKTMFKELATVDGMFFEGLVPLSGKERTVGAFSILLSQADTRKSRWQMVLSLVLVALVCVCLTIPLTWFFAIREIVEMERMQKELALHRDNLEDMVRERTLELSETNRLLDLKNTELNSTFEKVNSANREIMASLRYAKLIQRSLLPDMDSVRSFLSESFFIWSPSEIVGGDLFHADLFEEGFVIALFDCTGHGVPGAFMTMIASSGIRTVTRIENCREPAKILARLNQIIKTQLRQDSEHSISNDGMDAAVCFVGPETVNGNRVLRFAGSRISLACVSNGEMTIVKGDKQSIGYKDSDLDFKYTEHRVEAKDGMIFYMATDGITDQLGGNSGIRFGKKRFQELLKKISHLPLNEQRQQLLQAFKKYTGKEEILDDITVLGFRI